MNHEIFSAFPLLHTPRTDLRQVGWDDLTMVHTFNASLESLRYVAREPYTDVAQAEEKVQTFLDGFREREGLWWTFVLRETGQAMGYGGLFEVDTEVGTAEIGYGLLPEFWGRGYITEIVDEMVRFGFEDFGLARIHALVVPGNTASEAVLLKRGFSLVEVIRNHSEARGEQFDMGRYEMPKPCSK